MLAKACRHINIPDELVGYFALFLIRKEDAGRPSDAVILRKLQDFESPYISQRAMREPTRVVIRKSYWDPDYDLELMKNAAALNVLYAQTVWDMERGWVSCNADTQARLTVLQARGAKRDYLKLARTLKHYGHVQFAPCRCDYPRPDTPARVSIGPHELSLRVDEGADTREGSFRVTRMRCWRITAVHARDSAATGSSPSLELSFEYLMSRDRLQWITVASEQAILMSVCLQSVVDELLLKRQGARRTCRTPRSQPWVYMKRDGSSQIISPTAEQAQRPDNSFSIRNLQKKFSSVSFKSEREFVENHAFEGIGDEDL